MPFTRLLFSALEGDCSYTENGVTASLTNIPGTALLFKLDKHASVAASLAEAMQNAAQLPAPRVLICGSFLLAAEALALENA